MVPDVARRALDNDGSGRLTAGEFGAFMRLGERERSTGPSEKAAQWRGDDGADLSAQLSPGQEPGPEPEPPSEPESECEA